MKALPDIALRDESRAEEVDWACLDGIVTLRFSALPEEATEAAQARAEGEEAEPAFGFAPTS